MTRAAIIANRLWDEGNRAWRAALDAARAQGITLLELIERRVCEWERSFEMAKREERQ
jgi:hypothetical protein